MYKKKNEIYNKKYRNSMWSCENNELSSMLYQRFITYSPELRYREQRTPFVGPWKGSGGGGGRIKSKGKKSRDSMADRKRGGVGA